MEVEEERLEALRSRGGNVFPPPLPQNNFWIYPSIEQTLEIMYWTTLEVTDYSPGTLGAFHGGGPGQPAVPRREQDRFACDTFNHQPSMGYWWPLGASPVRNLADRAHVGLPEDPPAVHSLVHHLDGQMLLDEVREVLSREPYPEGTVNWPIAGSSSSAPPNEPSNGGASGVVTAPTVEQRPQPVPPEDVDMGDDSHLAGVVPQSHPLNTEDVTMQEVDVSLAAAVPLPDSDDESGVEQG
ncbi:hypothetical protein CYLTODRAFT_427257 [Cylindrobasidium torrendii FP15055 ss-10]|uniref:Uncharacterized protein n=1 Tax=Cylindrobasidium torrendii FP15055 ss-10 TaxID=1314674 RepID=A0A0D7AVS4_9AGAR|nr:hypothetical protein CYLTODRAFT_427257 [Cylindrobasidium torrendii FP15055 ss-10]